jgi:uncharacterized protein (TIGR02594 family)
VTSQLTRRALLLEAASLLTCVSLVSSQSAAIEEYRDFFSGDLPNLQQLGTKPALQKEIELADRLLASSPADRSALHVFTYLEHLKETNVDREAFNGGWRERWNPIIVRFFEQTKTKPSGDVTPWCAASLNWALARSGCRTTASASSGSFRAAPGLTENPQMGDVVVFASTNAAEAKVGRGHVGLFLDRSDDQIMVLGGNQKTESGHHAVCRKTINSKGKGLELHSFHAADAFRSRA